MKNIDKYDSVEEAIDAMLEYCDKSDCKKCKYSRVDESFRGCALRWAADEAKEEEENNGSK